MAWGKAYYDFKKYQVKDDKRWQDVVMVQQLQDANTSLARAHAAITVLTLERNALKDELQRYTSGATVSVPLADWNRLCAEAAKASQIPEPVAEESFPGRALRYSWGTK